MCSGLGSQIGESAAFEFILYLVPLLGTSVGCMVPHGTMCRYDLSGSTDPLQLCTKRSSLASLPSKAFLEELVEGSPMFDKLCEHTCHLADHLRVVKKMVRASPHLNLF